MSLGSGRITVNQKLTTRLSVTLGFLEAGGLNGSKPATTPQVTCELAIDLDGEHEISVDPTHIAGAEIRLVE